MLATVWSWLADPWAQAIDRRALAEVVLLGISGGQQQRVFLARALAQDAPLILLDEPLTGVDATSEDVILTVAVELASEGRTVMMATHDLAHAAEHSDMVVCLNRRLIAAGPSAEVFTPEVLAKTYGGPVILFSGHRD